MAGLASWQVVEEQNMECRDLRRIVDSYISDELLVETNHEVLRHLENCADCRREMHELRSLKTQIRHAVISSDDTKIDTVFAGRTAASLRDLALRPSLADRILGNGFSLNARLAVVGFSAILLMLLGGIYWFNGLNVGELNARVFGTNSNTDLVAAVRASWNELTGKALGDHENCAVDYKLKESPISLDEAAKSYGAYNKDIDTVITTALKATSDAERSNEMKFVESHSCIYDGRRFAHVVYSQKGRLVSFLVTDTDLPIAENDIQTALFDGLMNVAGFRAGHHAVFVVSDLLTDDNVTLAKKAAPAIRLHIEKLGA